MSKYICLKRHAKNSKAPGQTDPVVLPEGFDQSFLTATKTANTLTGVSNALIMSSHIQRGDQSGRAVSQAFRTANIETVESIEPSIDAKTPSDYFSILQALLDLPQYCLRKEFPIPDSVVIITHAHNILSHLIERLIDQNFQCYSKEEQDFLDALIETVHSGSFEEFSSLMADDIYERFRAELTRVERGFKPDYSEVRAFKLFQNRWDELKPNCGFHLETITG